MGLQVRKRTKGKSGWLNGSYSRKGAGVSGSVKINKNVTYNTGDVLNGKTKPRLTINLGNGVRYVHYAKSNRRTQVNQGNQIAQSNQGNYHPASTLMHAILSVGILILLIVICFVVFTLFVNFFWVTSSVIAVLVILYYIGTRNE